MTAGSGGRGVTLGGVADSALILTLNGRVEGWYEVDCSGSGDNDFDDSFAGLLDGSLDGLLDGSLDGSLAGLLDGSLDGSWDGSLDGSWDDSLDDP